MKKSSIAWMGGLVLCLSCGTDGMNVDPQPPSDPLPRDPTEETTKPPGACLPDVTCTGKPMGLQKQPWRHSLQSPTTLLAGSPNHRGVDLMAGESATEQSLRGEISYGTIDKALEDEDVELWACRAGTWQLVGIATTDAEGRFEYKLQGANRLPVGRRQVYISVRGDLSSVFMMAFVLPGGGKAAISDVDGTLTTYENAFPESIVTGAQVNAHDGAPEAFTTLANNCYQPVYVTARGTRFTEGTRKWLSDHNFPIGPLRLARGLFATPGDETVAYKVETMMAIQGAGVPLLLGNGNRASDAQAYLQVGLLGEHIFLKGPEYASEIDPVIARGEARGIDSYRSVNATWATYPRAY